LREKAQAGHKKQYLPVPPSSYIKLRETKILIMTGFDNPENRERAIREGTDSYLPKGGSFNNILKCIHNLLSTS